MSYATQLAGSQLRTKFFFFRANAIISAYAPFLTLINQLYVSDEWDSVEQLLDRAEVPLAFRALFSDWLAGRESKLPEHQFLRQRLHYQRQIRQSILSILYILSERQPLVLVLADLQHAPSSIWHLLQLHCRQQSSTGITMVCGYSSTHPQVDAERHEQWGDFCDFVATQARVPVSSTPSCTEGVEEQRFDQIGVKELSINALLTMAVHAISFFALEEALWIVQKLNEQYRKMRIHLSPSQQLMLDKVRAFVELLNDEFDAALAGFEAVYTQAVEVGQDEVTAWACRYTSLCYIGKSNVALAREFSERAIRISEALGGKEYAQCLFMRYYIAMRFTQTLELSQLLEIEQTLKQNDLPLHLINLWVGWHVFRSHSAEITPQLLLEKLKAAYRLSRSCRHKLGLADYYHIRSILFMKQRKLNSAVRCLKISYELKAELASDYHVSTALNGLGYMSAQTEAYDSSIDYYEQAFALAVKARDYNEICVTLYNITWLYFLAGQHSRVVELATTLLNLMRIRQIGAFAFRKLPDLHAMQGISALLAGDRLLAEQCVSHARREKDELSLMGEVFYQVLQAQIASSDGEYHEAERLYNEVYQQFEQSTDSDLQLPVLLSIWRYQNARHLSESVKYRSEQQLLELKSFCSPLLLGQVEMCLSGETGRGYPLRPLKISFEGLMEVARQDFKIDHLQHRLRELRVLHRLQLAQPDSATVHDLMTKAARIIHSDLDCKQIVLMLFEDKERGQEGLAYRSDGHAQLVHAQVKQWQTTIQASNYIQTLSILPPGIEIEEDFSQLLLVPMNSKRKLLGVIACLVEENQSVLAHAESLLELCSGQLAANLDQLLYEQQLLRISQTDHLTGLLNRQALYERLEEELSKVKHFPLYSSALLFLDLDNFKYHNDRFGHRLGDQILQLFAKRLAQCVRAYDVVCRYGGDEFIILMPSATSAEATHLAQRIVALFSLDSGFMQLLQQQLGEAELVPNEYLLSSSIGVSAITADDTEESASGLIALADAAMYRAKKAGKNQWSH